MRLIHRILAGAFCAALTAVLLPACASEATDICNALCECSGCTPVQHDACHDTFSASRDAAADYGCKSKFDDYYDCHIAKGTCTVGIWGTAGGDCGGEAAVLNECKKSNSARLIPFSFRGKEY